MSRDFVPDLSRCETTTQLATALGINIGILELLSGPEAAGNYRPHSIPKRSSRRKGEARVVFEPASEELKRVHKTIARRLTLYARQADPSFPAPCSLGYRQKKSIKDNAQPHCGADLLLRADIRDFFPTISQARVEGLLVRLRIPEHAAATLARLLCLDGHLTQGLSASPLLANLACHGLDARLDALAKKHNATYTRYADDISISGPSLPDRAAIAVELESEGFSLSDRKFRITKPGQAHYVTGLSVSDGNRPHVPREMKRRLRQELHYCKLFGIEEHLRRQKESVRNGLNRLDGTVSYVSFIERGTSHDYRAAWEALLARDNVSPTYSPRHDRHPTPQYCVVDETTIEIGTINYMALGWTLFSEINHVKEGLRNVLADYLSDPFAAGKKSAIEKEGLHFAAAHPDLQTRVIAALPAIPFRCYVVLRKFDPSENYEATYLTLLKWAVAQMYIHCDRQILTVEVEQNSRIARPQIETLFQDRYSLSQLAGIKRPLTEPSVTTVSKQSPYIALPDFMLGVLRDFVQDDPNAGSSSQVRFERLRDRFSLIYDIDRRIAYSRRNPFHRDAMQIIVGDSGQTG